MAVSSLFETSLQAVMRDFHHHEAALRYLPSLVKTRVARVMAKRGLLIEGNMKLVLHDGVTDLDLSECDISSSGLRVIWTLCPRLRRVDLNAQQGCRNTINSKGGWTSMLNMAVGTYTINSKAFCQFFTHCQRLQVVSLRCCVLLDNTALTCLVQNCPMLASLCVAGCHMISDRSLIVIGQKCRYLQALDVARTKLSTEGLVALANGLCSKLIKELNISYCLNITDEGIEALVTNCLRLSILVFHGCPLLTNHSRDMASGNTTLRQLTWTIY